MSEGVLLDMHVWVWSFNEPEILSISVRDALAAATSSFISPISFFEIGQKTRVGRWPDMEGWLHRLFPIQEEQNVESAPFMRDIALHAGRLEWSNRDPFDRIIAATADLLGLTLVSADRAFGALPRLRVIW